MLSRRTADTGTRVLKLSPIVTWLAVVLVGTCGCGSRMPIMNPDPRTHGEYGQDRDVCLRKHTFAVVGGSSGQCLHCELFVLCMESRMWRMDSPAPADGALPCCPGTEKPAS